MLADLAVLYPEKRTELLEQAEDAVLFWATDKPQPHANALRFLAATNSPKALPHMRKWAFPGEALPMAARWVACPKRPNYCRDPFAVPNIQRSEDARCSGRSCSSVNPCCR